MTEFERYINDEKAVEFAERITASCIRVVEMTNVDFGQVCVHYNIHYHQIGILIKIVF